MSFTQKNYLINLSIKSKTMNPNCKKCMDSTSGNCIEHTEKDMIEEAIDEQIKDNIDEMRKLAIILWALFISSWLLVMLLITGLVGFVMWIIKIISILWVY